MEDKALEAAKARAKAVVQKQTVAPKPKPAVVAEVSNGLDGEEAVNGDYAEQDDPGVEGTEADAAGNEAIPEGEEQDPDEGTSLSELQELAKDKKWHEVVIALGGDPKDLKGGPARLRKLNRLQAEVDGKLTRLSEREQSLGGRIHEANTANAATISFRASVGKKDWGGSLQAFSSMIPKGADGKPVCTLGELTQHWARLETGAAPANNAMARRLEELERREAERESGAQKQTAEQATQRDLDHITKTFAKHAVAKVPDFANLVRQEMHGSYDKDLKAYKLTLTEAARIVVKRETDRARRILGKAPARVEVVTKRPTVRTAGGRFSTPKVDPNDEDAKFKALVTNVKRKHAIAGRVSR